MGTSPWSRPCRGAHSHCPARHQQDLRSTCFAASLWAKERTHLREWVIGRPGGWWRGRCGQRGETGWAFVWRQKGVRGGGPPCGGGEGWCEVRRVTGLCLLESVGEYLSRRWTTLLHRNPSFKLFFIRYGRQHVQDATSAPSSGLGNCNIANWSLIKCSQQFIY